MRAHRTAERVTQLEQDSGAQTRGVREPDIGAEAVGSDRDQPPAVPGGNEVVLGDRWYRLTGSPAVGPRRRLGGHGDGRLGGDEEGARVAVGGERPAHDVAEDPGLTGPELDRARAKRSGRVGAWQEVGIDPDGGVAGVRERDLGAPGGAAETVDRGDRGDQPPLGQGVVERTGAAATEDRLRTSE